MSASSVPSPRAGVLRRGERVILPADRLDDLVQALRRRGFEVRAPVARDGALVHEAIESAAALPAGLADEQAPGRYRLGAREDGALFGYAVGPRTWRHELHPQRQKLLESRRGKGGAFTILPEPPEERRLALLGVRPCDLQAIAVQDQVLAHGAVADPHYVAAKKGLFVVAVSCAAPGGTCFCASMGTGPRAKGGFDLALTELVAGAGAPHRFVAEVGSDQGGRVAAELGLAAAPAADVAAAEALVRDAAGRMGRTLDAAGVAGLLARNRRSPRWEEVAQRCLSCTSCTLVCPTCYCTNVVDRTDVTGEVAVRWRRWDSCHTMRHSYIHGGSVRKRTASRYRQWLTHKLSSWKDQFGQLGCTGCGRCITWCPAGIDITAEVAAIRDLEAKGEVQP